MINKIAFSQPRSLISALRYKDVRSYLLTGVFVMLAVAVPWVFHQFHLAGPTFLPMHIFVILAGLLFGWRAGVLREKFHLRTAWSLLGAMIGGRLALLATISIIYLIAGSSYSPLGMETGPLASFWSTVQQGWPGIVIQLAFIPLIVWLVGKFTAGDIKGKQI
jgi:hypothetical protein